MDDLVDARVETRCQALGVSPPEVPARLRLERDDDGWRLYASSPEPSVAPLIRWLERHAPSEIGVDAARLVTASFPTPPRSLAILAEPGVTEATIDPEGRLCLFVHGPREDVHALLSRLQKEGVPLQVKHLARPLAHPPLLTPGQEEAVRAAADAGYYLIPRALTLHDLASSLGVSPASLSERLRRAEARLVMRYVREHGQDASVGHDEPHA